MHRFWETHALLAQLVEQLTLNQWVQGSSPWRRTKQEKILIFSCFFYYILWQIRGVHQQNWGLCKKFTGTSSLYTHFSCPFCKARGTRSAAAGVVCKHPKKTLQMLAFTTPPAERSPPLTQDGELGETNTHERRLVFRKQHWITVSANWAKMMNPYIKTKSVP